MKNPSPLQKANQLRWLKAGQLIRDQYLLLSMLNRYNSFLKESDKNCFRQLVFTLSIEVMRINNEYKAQRTTMENNHGKDKTKPLSP